MTTAATGLGERIAAVTDLDPARRRSSSTGGGGPGASSAPRSRPSPRPSPDPARPSGCCCATARPRSARSSASCAPAGASWPSTPSGARSASRDDIAGLDLPFLAGSADDLAALVDPATAPTLITADDLGGPVSVRAGVPGGHPDRPGVAVRMLTSGTTGPPKRVDLTSETLERVLLGAKYYEKDRATRAAPARGRGHRELTARPPGRDLPGAPVRRTTAGRSRCSSGSPSTPGPTPSGATGPRPPASSPPPCAWCWRPTSTRPIWPASGRWCRGRRRCRPTTPTPSPPGTASPSSCRTPRPSSAAASPAGTWPTTSGSGRPRRAASAGRTPGASCRSSMPTTGVRCRRRRGGPARGPGRRTWATTPAGSAPPTGPASTPTASCGSSVAPTRPILRGGFKVHPDDVRAALERHPRVRGAAVVGLPDRRLGAVPVAAVELRPDRRRSRPTTWRRTRRRCSPATRSPSEIRIVAALPRTDSHKVDLVAVRALFDGSVAGGAEA